jgi:CheY-like chemotaxis protein
MSPLHPVLLAEDNPNDVELTVEALRSLRLANEIAVVQDGTEALDWLFRRGRWSGRRTLAPALVLLDLKMPKLGGHEVLAQMRASPELRTIPVVILTSSREESDLCRSYQLGVNAYVVKPVGFEDFISTVARLGVFWAVLNEPPPRGEGAPNPP